MGGGIRPLPLFLLTPIGMGALRKFSRAVQNPQHLKKLTVFRYAEAAKENFLRFCDILDYVLD